MRSRDVARVVASESVVMMEEFAVEPFHDMGGLMTASRLTKLGSETEPRSRDDDAADAIVPKKDCQLMEALTR